MKQLSILALCLVGLLSLNACSPMPTQHQSATAESVSEPIDFDEQIAFHQSRVETDPSGAIGWAMLSEAYLAKAGAKDDDQAAIEAEQAARRSLKIRSANNSRAAVDLTHSLLAQHRFADAFESAKRATEIAPGGPAELRLYAETLLELGHYDEFKTQLPKLKANHTDPATLLVLARWADITGDPDLAESQLKFALSHVQKALGKDAEGVVPFLQAFGEHHLKYGKLKLAESEFTAALSINPNSYKALGGLAKVAHANSDHQAVINWGTKATAIAKMTNIQGLIAKAYAKLGHTEKAQQFYALIDKENISPEDLHSHQGKHSHSQKTPKSRHTHNRLYAQVMADAGLHPQLAHHIAEGDLASRQDIYAHATFAWATYRYWQLVPASETGEGDALLMEANESMKRALFLGSKDPLLLRQHAEIESSLQKLKKKQH